MDTPIVHGKQLHETAVQMGLLQVLLRETTPNAVGVACSYLLHCALNEPEVLRRVLNEKVIREGFTGVSLLELLNKVGR